MRVCREAVRAHWLDEDGRGDGRDSLSEIRQCRRREAPSRRSEGMSGGQTEDRQPAFQLATASQDRISCAHAPSSDGENNNTRRRKRFHRPRGAGSMHKARDNMPIPIHEVNGRVARSLIDFVATCRGFQSPMTGALKVTATADNDRLDGRSQ